MNWDNLTVEKLADAHQPSPLAMRERQHQAAAAVLEPDSENGRLKRLSSANTTGCCIAGRDNGFELLWTPMHRSKLSSCWQVAYGRRQWQVAIYQHDWWHSAV